jgi:hypothetical protein
VLRLDTVWNDDRVLLVHTQCANRAGSVIRGQPRMRPAAALSSRTQPVLPISAMPPMHRNEGDISCPAQGSTEKDGLVVDNLGQPVAMSANAQEWLGFFPVIQVSTVNFREPPRTRAT